jgi:hypothetical protein
VLRLKPFWDAQYVIPLLGMLLGNATSGVSVGLTAVLEEFASSEMRAPGQGAALQHCMCQATKCMASKSLPACNVAVVAPHPACACTRADWMPYLGPVRPDMCPRMGWLMHELPCGHAAMQGVTRLS